MKKFFLIVTASVFCVTSFAETVQQDSESIKASSIEMTCELSSDASAEFMSPSELMGPNDDGFIYKGTITLTRVVSGKRETFYLFNKRGVDYVATSKSGPYYRLQSRMTINNIDYKY